MDISFIIPAYNEQSGIQTSLDSIYKELSRNPDVQAEIIVVNNASTDNTVQVVSDFNTEIKIINETKKGLVFARAAGANAALGELLAHIDADCNLPQGWLSLALKEFREDSKLVALSGPQFYYDIYKDLTVFEKIVVESYHVIFYWVYLFNSRVLKIGSILQGGNFIVRSWAWKQLEEGNLDINFYGEDTDLCRRLYKLGNVKFNPRLVINASGRRLKKEGLVKTGGLYIINYFWVLLFKKPATTEYKDIRNS